MTIPAGVSTVLANLDSAARELRFELRRLRHRPIESAIEAPAVIAKREALRAATEAVASATQAPLSVEQMRVVDSRLRQASDKFISLSGKLERAALLRDAQGAAWPRLTTSIVSIDGPANEMRAIADDTQKPQARSFSGKLLLVHPDEDIEIAIRRWDGYQGKTSLTDTVEGVSDLWGSFHRNLLTAGAKACLQGDTRCEDLYHAAIEWALVPEPKA